jgi:hypothetical protein
MIPLAATRCRHCGKGVDQEVLEEEEREYRRRRDTEPHRGVLILVLGILSIVIGGMGFIFYGLPSLLFGLPMGVASWVMGHKDLNKMRNDEMDSDGEGITQAGWICGIVGASLSAVVGLCCGSVIIFAIVASITGK